jgi:membrane protein YdbS with pleckstrin-like domain
MNVEHLIQKKSYEHVVYILRRHPFTFLSKIALFVVLFFVPILIYLMITNLFPTIVEQDAVYVLGILLGSLYYLMILLLFYTQFIVFYLDMWVITNDRIVDVEQLGLFSRTVSELDLFRIQDVTADVHGVFATFLKYGTITVKTASTNVHIVFYDIPKPNTIREELIKLSHEDRKYHYRIDRAENS